MILSIAISVNLAMNYSINQRRIYARYLIAVISLIAFFARAQTLIFALIAHHPTIWLVMDKIVLK